MPALSKRGGLVVSACTLAFLLSAAAGTDDATVLASLAGTHAWGYYQSYPAATADEGRYVVFESDSPATWPEHAGAFDGKYRLFGWDRNEGRVSPVLDLEDGSPFGMDSFSPSVSADGRFVLFNTEDPGLVLDDGNPYGDVYLWDRRRHRFRLVSRTLDGGTGEYGASSGGAALSADGRAAVFASASPRLSRRGTSGWSNAFLRNLRTGRNTLITRGYDGGDGNDATGTPAISANGRFVAFWSLATNLVPGVDAGGAQIYRWDRRTRRIVHVSPSAGDDATYGFSYDPVVSDDGNLVAFYSYASDLVEGDGNDAADVFVRDLRRGTTTRISVANDGTERREPSTEVSMSRDGRRVVFRSRARLVPEDANDDWDVYAWDAAKAAVRLVSKDAEGNAAGGLCFAPAGSLSAGGSAVAYASRSPSLVQGGDGTEFGILVADLRLEDDP